MQLEGKRAFVTGGGGALGRASSVLVASGHAAPITTSPFLNSSDSSEDSAQYFLMRWRCAFSRLTAALSCDSVSSYGSVIPRLGCVFERYSAASAIWIGLLGTVIAFLYFEL